MNRSYSKIRHIQESNQRLEKRFLVEESDQKIEKKFISEQTVPLLTVLANPFLIGIGSQNVLFILHKEMPIIRLLETQSIHIK